MTEQEIDDAIPGIIKRIALLFVGASLIGLMICYTTGRWSVRGFRDIQFGLGIILGALGWLKDYSQGTQLKWFTYIMERSKGFTPLEERPPHSLRAMLWADSEPLPYFISGLLTIGTGLGIYSIYG